MGYVEQAFDFALLASAVILVVLLGALLRAMRPYENFERGIATLV